MMFFCESTLEAKPVLDGCAAFATSAGGLQLVRHLNLCSGTRRWGGLLKIPQPRMLSWLFEGGDREEHDGVDRHGPIVRRVCILR